MSPHLLLRFLKLCIISFIQMQLLSCFNSTNDDAQELYINSSMEEEEDDEVINFASVVHTPTPTPTPTKSIKTKLTSETGDSNSNSDSKEINSNKKENINNIRKNDDEVIAKSYETNYHANYLSNLYVLPTSPLLIQNQIDYFNNSNSNTETKVDSVVMTSVQDNTIQHNPILPTIQSTSPSNTSIESSAIISIATATPTPTATNTATPTPTATPFPATIVVGSSAGFFYYSNNTGATFTKINTPGTSYVAVVAHKHISTDRDSVVVPYYAANAGSAGVYLTVDQGQNWANTSLAAAGSAQGVSVKISDSGRYIMTSGWANYGVYVSSDYGTSFTKAINAQAGTGLFMSASGQYLNFINWQNPTDLNISSDYGANWTTSGVSLQEWPAITHNTADGEFFVVGDKFNGAILYKSYGSIRQVLFDPTMEYTPIQISYNDAEYIAAINEDNRVFHFSTDQGTTWDTSLTIPGSSNNISALIEIPMSYTHHSSIFVVNQTDFPTRLYQLNSTNDGFDLVHTFPANIAQVVAGEDYIAVMLTDKTLYVADLIDLDFNLVHTFVEAGVTATYLDIR